ncbi:hypothetical protein BDV38DRAFT_252700 [Aspergillus pseudotamarii]|uniref:Rhodopsin domain-containing protein n=1 Tax=Aspergillus pseudotamarii TaxID=132259 RepID=A0A5N6SQI0_ASPPS|nr:uncharacterized protein BDV38DRAFT_252700 [Aspergillus pseudotamarii]KAE8135384.1 hypothetical protein BDV38DRAFT_252700 [Aspergillus pseudotamarii]
MNQEALCTGLAVCHIMLDIALVALPVILICKVQMSQWKCLQICALFGLRVLVPALTIQYIVSLRPVFHSIPLDQPWHILMPTLWLQLIQGASIICTCIPNLKRALAELQTGMMAGTVSELFELSVSGAHSELTDGPTSKPGRQRANATEHYGLDSGGRRKKHMEGLRPSNHRRMIEPSESMRDLRGSAIIQTVGYEVRWEGGECSRSSSTSRGIPGNHGDGLSGW